MAAELHRTAHYRSIQYRYTHHRVPYIVIWQRYYYQLCCSPVNPPDALLEHMQQNSHCLHWADRLADNYSAMQCVCISYLNEIILSLVLWFQRRYTPSVYMRPYVSWPSRFGWKYIFNHQLWKLQPQLYEIRHANLNFLLLEEIVSVVAILQISAC